MPLLGQAATPNEMTNGAEIAADALASNAE